MRTTRSLQKPLLPLLRSTSDSKLSPVNFYVRKKFVSVKTESSDEEKEEVELLNEWEKRDSKLEILNSIKEATLRLNKRITGQDIVEDIIAHRRLKRKLPNIKSSNIISLAKTSKLRQKKKESDQNFKERCRYFRQFEEELAKNHKELLALYQDYKKNRNDLRQECCVIKKKANDALHNYEKIKEEVANMEFTGNSKDWNDFSVWKEMKNGKMNEMKRKEWEKNLISEKVNEEITEKQEKLNELDEICKNLRKKVELVRRAQINHYLGLLKEGKDVKSEGIQWIVIALWKLNQTVSIDNFPSFLDEDAIHCILFISQKALEAEEILENIVNPARKSSVFEPSIDKTKSIKQRLAKLKKKIKVERPEYITDKKTKQVIIKWIPIEESEEDESIVSHSDEVLVYENYIGKIKDLIQETKSSEVNRLAIECNLHNYEERFKVTMKDLINAMVGSEACERFLAILSKDKKKLIAQIESTRTFNFTSKFFL